MKIGIIQSSPLPADFSNNLRHIVQGYRACLDHGAEIVVASAHAMCGPGVHDLVQRDSFREQMELALQTLSRELGDAPLVLGAYSTILDEDSDENEPILPRLTPYWLENDMVDELENGELTEWQGLQLCITTDDAPMQPGMDDCDIIIHTASSPWYAALPTEENERRRQEALNNEATIVYASCVGTSETQVYGGGSAVYSPTGKTLLRLPWFERENRTVGITPPYREASVSDTSPAAILALMVQQGIRDSVRQYGYAGVCIPMDFANSELLLALAIEAVGRSNVFCVTFDGASDLADKLGLECKKMDADSLFQVARAQLGSEETHALTSRLKACLLSTYSDSRGLMLLSPLGRREIMLGQFTLYGESCGILAPLGSLYEMDLHMLRCELKERNTALFGTLSASPAPEQDIIIHALADCNISAGRFIRENNFGLQENEIRAVQRRIITSALKRSQFPFVLQAASPAEYHCIPSAHRLND